jgi:large subunit ribosomal protein L9
MEVILREDVHGLGRAGEVVKVKPGYARNYLIPQQMAVEATRRNLKQLQHQKGVIAKRADKHRAEAASLGEKMAGLSVTVAKAVGSEDRLYGSVTGKDIVQSLIDEGITGIDKKRVVLQEPIRQLGIYDVPIKLSAETTVEIKLWVVAK